MQTAFSCLESVSNPFAQIVDRGRVLAAVHRSERLNALASHVFHPLAWLPASHRREDEAHDHELDPDEGSNQARPGSVSVESRP